MNDKIILAEKPYVCLQGEGKYIGIPHILVRMTGCDLRCVFCVEENTEISTVKNGLVKANNVLLNDILQTPLDNTKIIEKHGRVVSEYIEVELEDGRVIKVTSEHPFITNNGLIVLAEDLKDGDEVIVMK